MEAVAPDFGIFAVALNRRPGGAWLWQYSYLPGPGSFACSEESTRGRVTLRHCPGVDPGRPAELFARALDAASAYFPTLADAPVGVTLVPPGVGMRLQRSGPVAIERPALMFAVRWDGTEQATRSALRAIVHEAVHVVRRAGGAGRHVEEEVLAYALESCVEHDVFGSTAGFVYRDELNPDAEALLSGSASTSARGQGRAYALVMQSPAMGGG